MARKIEDVGFEVTLNNKDFKKGAQETAKATAKMDKEVQKASKGVEDLNKNLSKSKGFFATVRQGIKNFGAGIKSSAGRIRDFIKRNLKLNTVLKQSLTLFAGFSAARAVKNFFVSSFQAARDFEREMVRINTVTQLSKEELDDLGDSLKELSKNLAIPLEELQRGLFDVASAGIVAEQQISFLTAATAFSRVGAFDLSVAVEGLTAILKGYGEELSETEKILNLFLQANVKGQTTLGDLADAVQGVAGIANNAGVDMEEFFAILATGTGVTGNAREVATQLRGAINALAAPTKEASTRFDELGIEVGKSAIEEKGFVEVAKEVFDAVGGDAEQLRRLIPEVEASTLVIALATTQYDRFNENLTENRGELELVRKQYIEYAKTTEGQTQVILNAYNRLKISAGNLTKQLLVLLAVALKNPLRTLETIGSKVRVALDTVAFSVSELSLGISEKLGPNSKATKAFEKININVGKNLVNSAEAANDSFANLLVGDQIDQLDKSFAQLANSVQTFGSDAPPALGGVRRSLESVGGASSEAAEETEKAAEDTQKSIQDITRQYDKWQDGIQKTEKQLENLRDKNEKFFEDIRKSIRSVTNEIGELNESFEVDISEQVVEAERQLENLADELKEAEERQREVKRDSDAGQKERDNAQERVDDINAQIKAQDELIASSQELLEQGIITEEDLEEARRKAGLNAIQLRSEEFKAEKAILEERKALLQAIQDGEEINLEEIQNFKNLELAEELLIRQAQIQEEIRLVQQQQVAITQAWIEGAQAIEQVNDQLIATLDQKYQDLADRIRSALSSASAFVATADQDVGEVGGQNGGFSNQFQSGGLTGMAPTNQVKGTVHGGEWVANSRFVRDNRALIGALDKAQRKGFQDGGMVTTNSNNRSVTINPTVSHKVGLSALFKQARFLTR